VLTVPATPPHAIAVQVVATRPTPSDDAAIAHANEAVGREVGSAVHVVMLRLETVPQATGSGYALYVGEFRVPKYWEYPQGIYFKVYDPQFLADHAGEPLRFTANGTDFIDTGLHLSVADTVATDEDLPDQRDILR
jgi:hypothetical protein